jgi:carboxypeptidase Taq
LQDVHWSGGSIGYFPTYALGNLISAQIWEKITGDLPGLEDDFEQGEFGGLRDWLRDNLHMLGRKYTPGETLERVVGTAQIDPEPYVRYLRSKLADIYGIATTAA